MAPVKRLANEHPDPCVNCGHGLREHRRGRSDPRNVYVCACGCVIEFEPVP
jgi:hypothetical protein